ncbi:MAG: flippase [Candidatus Tritonobacter lacicola]|nr:flippase [Candidatus Tritonobacter lacicola]
MSNPLRTLAKNTVAVFVSNIINIGFGVLLLSIVSRYLGAKGGSNYFFLVAIAEMLKLIADFGVEGIITREVARNRDRAEELMDAALSLRLIIVGVAFLVEMCVVLALGMPLMFILALAIATASQLFASTAMLFISVYKGFEKMEYETLLAVVLRGISILLLIIVAKFDLGFVAIFASLSVSQLIRMVVGLIIIHRKFTRVRLKLAKNIWAKLLGESYPLGLSAFFLMASFNMPVFMIKSIGKAEDVSLFSLPHTVVLQLVIVSSATVVAIFPVFSRLALSSIDALKVAFDKSFKLLFSLGLLFFILIVKYAPPIVLAIGGSEFEASGAALRILGCAIPFLFLVQLTHYLLISADRQGYVLASLILCFSLNLCLDIITVPRWGYIGASWSMLASYALLCVVSLVFARAKVVAVDCVQLIRPLLAAVPAGLLLLYAGDGLGWGAVAVAAFLAAACLLRAFTLEDVRLLGEALAHPPRGGEGGGA